MKRVIHVRGNMGRSGDFKRRWWLNFVSGLCLGFILGNNMLLSVFFAIMGCFMLNQSPVYGLLGIMFGLFGMFSTGVWIYNSFLRSIFVL